jgi:hypothetical protein
MAANPRTRPPSAPASSLADASPFVLIGVGIEHLDGRARRCPYGRNSRGLNGVIDGGTIGQICGAQIGCRSVELLQIACTEPLTHRHTHPAKASGANCTNEKAVPK